MTNEPKICPSLVTRGLCHSFGSGAAALEVLHDVDFTLKRGELVILMGPSGSGKTTLLTLVACLRRIQKGSVKLLGQELAGASENVLTRMRQRLGFIFQAHNLHNSLTAIQNVRMGLEVHRPPEAPHGWEKACGRVLDLVGLGDRMNYFPAKLSGGQKQRVAVARALVGDPDIIFADEPTAALDMVTGRQVIELLRRLADQRGTSIFMVTHDHRILEYADRIVKMEDGRIIEDSGQKI